MTEHNNYGISINEGMLVPCRASCKPTEEWQAEGLAIGYLYRNTNVERAWNANHGLHIQKSHDPFLHVVQGLVSYAASSRTLTALEGCTCG